MRIPRFYCPELNKSHELLNLPPQAHRHAIQVLRLKEGARINLFDGKGLEVSAELQKVSKRESFASISSQINEKNESPLPVRLIQSISRSNRMDYTLQKAVELGVTEIVPVITTRCNGQFSGPRADKKRTHWEGVIISACEQSGRNVVPTLADIQDYEEMLAGYNQGTRLILEPQAEEGFKNLQLQSEVSLLIGPEGGFSDEEVQQAIISGFQVVKFGPRILRTETAAISAIAVIQTLWGDIG